MPWQTAFPSWTRTVHHDGSAVYLSDRAPEIGDIVTVHLRAASSAPLRGVYVRTFPDGEQHFMPMTRRAPSHGADHDGVGWWSADLPVNAPTVHYRFLLDADDGLWAYSAAGVSAIDPLDATDFRLIAGYAAPRWVTASVFYQIFPDRFANGDPGNDPQPADYTVRGRRPRTLPWGATPAEKKFDSLRFYGGDLPGIAAHLDYLTDLGINAIYLNPIFTARSNHRYDVVDYEHVDPRLGGDAALADLRAALDARGMRYLLDIVPNHCGYYNHWFQAALADPAAPEAAFFTFDGHPDRYATWLGVWSLPKLNYRDQALRRRMYQAPDSIFRRWLKPPYAADGWRIDVANMLGRQGETQIGDEIGREIRQAVKATAPESYLLGENFFDASPQLQGDQYDACMNYAGFAFPLLHWLRRPIKHGQGLPQPVRGARRMPTAALAESWQSRLAAIPYAIALQQFNLLGSHDVPRLRTLLDEDDALHRLALALLFTFPGVPCLYYGDEIGMVDDPVLRSRGCMVWDEAAWDRDLRQYVQSLIALRRGERALQRGGFQILAVEADTIAFQREAVDRRVLVVASRRPRPAGPLNVAHGGVVDGAVFRAWSAASELRVEDGALSLPALPVGASVWLA